MFGEEGSEGRNDLSDGLVSLKDASFGTTTAKAGSVLSDEYIARRIDEGKGKYISFDKEVDTSTVRFQSDKFQYKKVSLPVTVMTLFFYQKLFYDFLYHLNNCCCCKGKHKTTPEVGQHLINTGRSIAVNEFLNRL